MDTYLDSDGKTIRLGRLIGKGGEGEVYSLTNAPTLVAKIYHRDKVDLERRDKLNAMIGTSNDDLKKYSAWPHKLAFENNSRILLRGFIMPNFDGFKEMHELYNPKSRLSEFPSNANWAFLVHTGIILCHAVRAIHRSGHVVGDMNEKNFVVSQRALVRAIDCDSFHINLNGRSFPCRVGVETFIPPELQGQSLSSISRTHNHDAFGLAVLIFHLLFLGRHPFAGRFSGPGDMPIDRAIREFRFAYGADAASRQMSPPPDTLSMKAVTPEVASLFERAFGQSGVRDGSRPGASEWLSALRDLKSRIINCDVVGSHRYLKDLPRCPWCELEGRSGRQLFAYAAIVGQRQAVRFDLAAIWASIESVPAPGLLPVLPSSESLGLTPDPAIVAAKAQSRDRRYGALFFVSIAFILVLALPIDSSFIFWIEIGVLWLGYRVWQMQPEQERRAVKLRHEAAQARFNELRSKWDTLDGSRRFATEKRQLLEKRRTYQNLSTVREQKLTELQRELRKVRHRQFLERYRIDQADIPGIGPARVASLISHGIETAYDATESKLLRVPGIGEVYAGRIVAWRASVGQRFRFDPAVGIQSAELAQIDNEITRLRQALENDLADGRRVLEKVRSETLAARNVLYPTLVNAHRNLVQAEVDLSVF